MIFLFFVVYRDVTFNAHWSRACGDTAGAQGMDAYGISVIVRGTGEYGSAIARELFLAGNAVVLQQSTPPAEIRRLRCFSDAWFCSPGPFAMASLSGAQLEGVFARRVDSPATLTACLGRREAIPLAAMPLEHVISAWPWAVLVDARMLRAPAKPQRHLAGLTIGLGGGFLGGETVDLVIGCDDQNPGAFVPTGHCLPFPQEESGPLRTVCRAPHDGIFHTAARIGDRVSPGETIGWVGASEIRIPDHAPQNSLIRGLPRDGATVRDSDEILDLAPPGSRVSGVSVKARTITRAVMLAIASDGEPIHDFLLRHWR
ncbi:xanthine dehydrogenase accessory factor [Insolitispirillum peregrinum]|uniref:Xanthine dehydrogenase accessory factor n=2 Tax=Insolitispirillum peregrinum TaxID=80876 RepID=A0A1N7IJ55_9PROT|nr:xanthine dehydrogenase accessory factor [Insolitispirillum peregrinum]